MPTASPNPSSNATSERRACPAEQILGWQDHTIRLPPVMPLPSQPIASARPAPRRRRELKPLDAVVFLPPGTPGAGLWTDACGDYIQKRGYRLAAVCSAWKDVVRLLFDGLADVVVVGRRDHLPRDRRPRVEFVTEAESTAEHHRRPQRRS